MRKDSIKPYVPSIVLLAVCSVSMLFPPVGFTADAAWHNLAYHFCHANWFHLLAAVPVLYAFKPRWSTLFVAYLCATAASLVPFCQMDVPTCGMSALLFAALARRYAVWRISPLPLLALNMVFIFVPSVNWAVHLVSFLLAYFTWILLKKI